MRCTCRVLLSLLFCSVVLAGCSRATLVYRNLDVLVPWSLNDYLDLNRAQQDRLRERIRTHLAWHCRSQLPDLLDDLQRLQHDSSHRRLDGDQLQPYYRDIRQAIQAIAVEITPTATELLRALDDAQVRELAQALEADQREHREQYLAPPLPQQIRERAERMGERLEHWLGPLDAAQRQRVLAWSHSLGEQNARWLNNREQWQRELLDTVRQRDQADFAARIARLLQDREALLGEADRAALQHAERAALGLLADLHGMADGRQREHLVQRLQQMRQDLAGLECLPASAAPARA
ncbi:MAG: DUF6279 family lipoprotein [Pseudomonadaceae bacterium]